MANLSPSASISYQLTDAAGTPLLSSSSSAGRISQPQSEALSSLTTSAVTACETSLRLKLGLPQRILIETSSSGPIILHSYLNSLSRQTRPSLDGKEQETGEQAREDLRPLSAAAESESEVARKDSEDVNGLVNGLELRREGAGEEREDDEASARFVPPMLVATVVAASAAEAGEARRVAAWLERIGREFQKEWVRQQEVLSEPTNGGNEDG